MVDSVRNNRTAQRLIDCRVVCDMKRQALSASADAKLTGKIAVCFGSAGPGAVHLLNGLYDAKIDRVPVLASVAQVPTKRMNIDFFQTTDEEPIFDDVYCSSGNTLILIAPEPDPVDVAQG